MKYPSDGKTCIFAIFVILIGRRYYKHQDSLIAQFEDLNLGVDDAMENTEELSRINKTARRLSKVSFFVNLVNSKGSSFSSQSQT